MIYQDLELIKGDTWIQQFDLLPELAGWVTMWFTARRERDALDTTSLFQVKLTNGGGADDGLTYLNAAAAATPADAALSVAGLGPPGIIDLRVEAAATSVLDSEQTTVFYDLQVDIAGDIRTLQYGLLLIPHDSTRAID